MDRHLADTIAASEVPHYEVIIDQIFIEPEIIYKGSIIASYDPPGGHLKPLNPPAVEAMNAWYDEEVAEYAWDKGVLRATGERIKPRADLRPRDIKHEPRYGATLVAAPPPRKMEPSLAELLNTRQPTDPRPPPAVTRTDTELPPGAEASATPPPGPIGPEGTSRVLSAAPPPSIPVRRAQPGA